MDIAFLFQETRARVYLMWAVIVGVGYTATHYYQNPNINGVWFVLSLLGLGYMFRTMPLKVRQMKAIYIAWLAPIAIGFVFSAIAARTDLLPGLLGYLGAFWLFIQAIGFFWNGLVDSPSEWYYIAAAANFTAAIVCYVNETATTYQYLVAAIVSVWSMLMLWLFRSDA